MDRLRSFLARCGWLQGRLVFVIGLGHCRSFQVISYLLQVVAGCFLFAVGRFKLFQVIPRFSKYPDEELFLWYH